jgi:hypothetical protein
MDIADRPLRPMVGGQDKNKNPTEAGFAPELIFLSFILYSTSQHEQFGI